MTQDNTQEPVTYQEVNTFCKNISPAVITQCLFNCLKDNDSREYIKKSIKEFNRLYTL